MYQAGASNLVITSESIVTTDVNQAMWELFVVHAKTRPLARNPPL
jgi:hypothetical protein